ncbi:MAG: efflux transporter outer membrane subunit [Acidobacteriia bacterium]|nr:efflux transporter outer membrane subunit [Terriglobia bacterium]
MNKRGTRKRARVPAWRTVGTGLVACALCLTGCVAGPNYQRPSVQTPSAWKEAPPAGWKNATPHDEISKGNWWQAFSDAELDQLETQATADSQSLKAAAARLAQARAVARITRADLRPTVTLDPSAARSRQSANRPVPPPLRTNPFTSSTFTLPLDVSYEADVWGRVRRSLESSQAQAQASAADYQNLLLALRAEVAQDYFHIRYLDDDRAILRENIELLKRALQLTEVRHAGGAASGLDVSEARTLLEATQAGYDGTERERSQFEHALAVLVGKPAAEFSLPEAPLRLKPPAIPAGLPSDLLERRPDIAEAERLMVAASAQIGVQNRMSLKAKLEAIIYAAVTPITLDQMVPLVREAVAHDGQLPPAGSHGVSGSRGRPFGIACP